MSTKNDGWKLDQKVKVFTSKTTIPQWITGKIIHKINKKLCIQYDDHWVDCIDTSGINAYEWILINDKNTIINDFRQETVQYSTLPTHNSKIDDSYSHNSIISDRITMPNPINELHEIKTANVSVFWNRTHEILHQKWNEQTHKFQTLSVLCKYEMTRFQDELLSRLVPNFNSHSCKRLIYIESLKQLFAFVYQDLFYCDVKCKNQTKYIWKRLGISLPIAYQIILAFDNILFIYPYSNNDIYCIDLTNHKFFISNKSKPETDKTGIILNDTDNMIHYIDDETNKYHYKWSLHEIIPRELTNFYRNKYQPLIIGYIKEEEKALDLSIPYYLKQIVLKFYPTFI